MKDLMDLRDLLAGAEVPKGVLGVAYDDIQRVWDIHMREEDFRKTFDVYTHKHYFGDDYELSMRSQRVRFFCLTHEEPEESMRPRVNWKPSQELIDEIRAEHGSDLLSRARNG